MIDAASVKNYSPTSHAPAFSGESPLAPRHGLVREDFVPRTDQRIGLDGDALALVALGNQLRQHGGLDMGTPGVGMTDARHQVWPGK